MSSPGGRVDGAPVGRVLLTLLLCFLLAQILYDPVLAGFSRIAQDAVTGRDFSCFYAAARVADAGGNFYDRQQLQHHAEQAGYRHPLFPYLYPPFFLSFVVPWTALSYRAAFTVWVVMLSALLGLTLWMFHRMLSDFVPQPGERAVEDPCGLSGRYLLWFFLLFVGAVFNPIRDNFWQGQSNLWTLAFVTAFLYLGYRGKRFSAGVALALATLIKLNPALLLLFLLWKKEFRLFLTAAVAGLVLMLLSMLFFGWEVHREFFTTVLPTFRYGRIPYGLGLLPGGPGNHSLYNLCIRFFSDSTFPGLARGDTGWGVTTAKVLALLLLGVSLWRTRTFRTRPESPSAFSLPWCLECSAMLILTVILPTFAWEHHFVLVLPAVFFLVAGLLACQASRILWVLYGAAVFVLSLPIEPYFGLIHVWEGPDTLVLPLRTLAYHLKTFAALTLWGICLIMARRLGEKRNPACCQTDLL